MVDAPEFSERWERALRANGVTNAWLAAQLSELGQNGQQNIRSWKDRGQIGARSVRAVAKLLPRTNIDWLQYGEGAESLSDEAHPSHGNDVRQSYAERLDPATIRTVHEMLRWRFDYEGQAYNIEKAPELFSLAYQAALSGSTQDKAALKVAVDDALHRGHKSDDQRRDETPAPGARPDTPKRGGRRA